MIIIAEKHWQRFVEHMLKNEPDLLNDILLAAADGKPLTAYESGLLETIKRDFLELIKEG